MLRATTTWALAAAVPCALACGAAPASAGDSDPVDQTLGERADETAALGDGLVLKASFPDTSCDANQADILDAEELAAEFLEAIVVTNVAELLAGAGQRTMERDFGPISATDVETIIATFSLVARNLTNTSYLCRPEGHPDCSGEFLTAFARTNERSSETRLCPAFFDSFTPLRRRAVLLIHELTHQNRNSPFGTGTVDDGFPSVRTALSFEQYASKCFEIGCLL